MKVSVVATLFYSDPYIREFYRRVTEEVKKITGDYEIIFVNDGSPDSSGNTVLELQAADPRIILVDLSRNFGHHRAILTGLHMTTGDFVFLIDTDLEEDPELLGFLWERLQGLPDTDVVYGVQQKRKGGFFERTSGSLFYRLFYYIAGFEYPSNTLTARIMSKRYVETLKNFGEKEMDLWGIFLLNGFKQQGIPVTKKNKGKTTYTFRRKFRIAVDSITSLTNRPLYFIFFLGLLITLISVIAIMAIFVESIMYNTLVDTGHMILLSLWLIGGIIMFTLGIIAIYISKIFLEVKNRPLSVIKHVYKKNDS